MANPKDVVDMVDTIHADVPRIPTGRHAPRKVAGYITGSSDIRWTGSDWDRFPDSAKVPINQSNEVIVSCPVCDIERGAMTIPVAIETARQRRDLGKQTTFYLSESILNEAEAAVRAHGLENHVFYGLANWSLSREQAIAELGGRIVWIQYGDPNSNRNTPIFPGSNVTAGEVNADVSVTLASWFPVPQQRKHSAPKRAVKRVRKVIHLHPKTAASGSGGGLATALVAIAAGAGIHITVTEAAGIATLIALGFSYLVPNTQVKP